ncbi:hypothetical protein PQE71_gp045 [Bacillus phage Izhevsk]|uniref:Uncharacterized protein n=1 Tax=Bacillus phage Izhevsk TaxID=2724322 RepID=A0A6H0X678_9CAUD|nr:hypothetical protein PQE71_gp045 [Bacillus phage Izhevsk]QIW89727.1 hypothetical protein Izhevsk_45 [Bacillus phage Izhevsk]
MDAIQLLKQFAEKQGIDVKEVDKFVKEMSTANTLADVVKLPHDMQKHVDYITYLQDPLKSFIQEEMYNNRYETITVDEVIDILYDRTYYLLDADNELDLDIDEIGFENLTTDDEDKKKELEKLKAVGQHIIDIKFGSVTMDW